MAFDWPVCQKEQSQSTGSVLSTGLDTIRSFEQLFRCSAADTVVMEVQLGPLPLGPPRF